MSLTLKLPINCSEKLVEFQQYIIGVCKTPDYLLGQISDGDETSVYFDMPNNLTISEKVEKSIILTSTGNENL